MVVVPDITLFGHSCHFYEIASSASSTAKSELLNQSCTLFENSMYIVVKMSEGLFQTISLQLTVAGNLALTKIHFQTGETEQN